MPIQYQLDYVDLLNRQYGAGKFIKAVVLTEGLSPLVVKYFADHEDSITFQGHAYTPLHMFWDKLKTSGGMSMEGADVTVSNVGNQVVRYLKDIDIAGNPVTLQLIHLDLLNTLTNYWTRYFKVLGVRADMNAAVFSVGRYLGRNRLPRNVLTADKAPGLNSDIPRIG
jgi:hypothetical protein